LASISKEVLKALGVEQIFINFAFINQKQINFLAEKHQTVTDFYRRVINIHYSLL